MTWSSFTLVVRGGGSRWGTWDTLMCHCEAPGPPRRLSTGKKTVAHLLQSSSCEMKEALPEAASSGHAPTRGMHQSASGSLWGVGTWNISAFGERFTVHTTSRLTTAHQRNTDALTLTQPRRPAISSKPRSKSPGRRDQLPATRAPFGSTRGRRRLWRPGPALSKSYSALQPRSEARSTR